MARLKRASDGEPGYTRRKSGAGFSYFRANGSPLRNAAELARIRALAIPPAWSSVWICPDSDGHIQATGRDARGRKQYRYHPRWNHARNRRKYDRVLGFARALPGIRRRIRQHLALKGLRRERVLAAVVRLLDLTSIRVGNSEYARDNNSFGLTTLRRRHVSVSGSLITFNFSGKGRKRHVVELTDRRLATIIRGCLALRGAEVFKYVNGDGITRDVTAADVNDYLREISGDDFTAKDFRTWTATMLVVLQLLHAPPAASERQRRARFLAAVDDAAARLGNTRAICRRSYVHPAIESVYVRRGRAVGPRCRPASLVFGTQRGDESALKAIRRLANEVRGGL